MLPPKRKISDTENKLRVLMSLQALQMASRDQLWPFLARLDLMEYMTMCVIVDELCAQGALKHGGQALRGQLYLTDLGREYLVFFGSRIPGGDRARIVEAAPAYRRALGLKRRLCAVYELSPPGEYRVLCTFREGDMPTLVTRVITSERAVAHAAADCFEEAVPLMLRALYSVPPAEAGRARAPYQDLNEAMEGALAGAGALCAYGRREHGAVARLRGARATFVTALLMPSAQSAGRWLDAAQAQGAELADRLTAILMEAAARRAAEAGEQLDG